MKDLKQRKQEIEKKQEVKRGRIGRKIDRMEEDSDDE